MTHPTITCGRFNEELGDFLERSLPEPMRAAMEAHAVGCDDCGPLLADLRRLRIDAANLPQLSPSRDLWSGIAERIEAPVVALPGARSREQRRWGRYTALGVAAAALIAVTATITRRMDGGRVDGLTGGRPANGGAVPASVKAAPAVVASVVDSTAAASSPQSSEVASAAHPSTRPPVHPVSNRPTAEQTYDGEIAKLIVVYNQRRPELDSTTLAVVKKNLKIIDEAIAQTKLALKRDPASQFLMESLNDAFDTKVQLLRKVAMLPSGT